MQGNRTAIGRRRARRTSLENLPGEICERRDDVEVKDELGGRHERWTLRQQANVEDGASPRAKYRAHDSPVHVQASSSSKCGVAGARSASRGRGVGASASSSRCPRREARVESVWSCRQRRRARQVGPNGERAAAEPSADKLDRRGDDFLLCKDRVDNDGRGADGSGDNLTRVERDRDHSEYSLVLSERRSTAFLTFS